MDERNGVESERKFDVRPDAPAPPLGSLPGVMRVGEAAEHRLEALYFDTADLSLAAHGITLRRRTGGTDAGWHLKLPLGLDRRREIAEPLGPGAEQVPKRLQRLVSAHARRRPLVPVARLETGRTSAVLFGADGAPLAEFSDDRVTAQSLLPGGSPRAWREWELELELGPAELLGAVEELVTGLGGRPSAHPSKLARALGDSYPPGQSPAEEAKPKGPASAVLLAYLYKQTEALKAMDAGVREGEPDAVHKFRVATRRMRSSLATYRKLADRDAGERLRGELKWAATAVGEARDLEVMRKRLKGLVAAEQPQLLMGPVAQRIEEELGARHRAAHESGLAAMDSDRYFALLDALDSFLENPPLTNAGHRKAAKATARRVDHDLDRLTAAVRAAKDAEGTETADAALHEARKCAKRLRYAAESAHPLHRKRAKRIARDARGIQDTLGEFQDSVVNREFLREMGAAAYLEGANAFSYGRLHANEQQHGADARARCSRQWKHFSPKALH